MGDVISEKVIFNFYFLNFLKKNKKRKRKTKKLKNQRIVQVEYTVYY